MTTRFPVLQWRKSGRGFGGEIPDRRGPCREGKTDRWAIPAPGPHMVATHRGRETGAGQLHCILGRRGEFGRLRKKIPFLFPKNFQLLRCENKSGKNT
jgi:hypothetical protein